MSDAYLFLLAQGQTDSEEQWPVLVRRAQGHAYRSQLGELPPDVAVSTVVLVLPMERAACCVIGPVPGRRPSREALAYAAEEQLAEPLEGVHLAFGPVDEKGQRKVMVVNLAYLNRVMSRLLEQGIDPVAVHVDADMLCTELACALWFEGRWLLGGREGVNLAVSAPAAQVLKPQLASIPWLAAPEAMGAGCADRQVASAVETLVQGQAGALDLRQGSLRRRRKGPAWQGGARAVMLAWLMVCLADYLRAEWLIQQALQQRTDNVLALQRWAPEHPSGSDLATRIRLLEHSPRPSTAVEQLALFAEQLVSVGNVTIERVVSAPAQAWRIDVVAQGFDDLERLGARIPEMRMTHGMQVEQGVRATLAWQEAQ